MAFTEWILVSDQQENYDDLLNILILIPSILELSGHLMSSTYSPCEADPATRHVLDLFHTNEYRLLEWYWQLQNQQGEPLFLIHPATPGLAGPSSRTSPS